MILFAPAYDEPTRCTYLLAYELVLDATQPLLGPDATRSKLHNALAGSDVPVVALTHGSADHLRGQNGEPVLTIADAHSITRKAVLAYACHTGTKLGRAMSRGGNAWWGYSGVVAALPEDPTKSGIMVPLFRLLIEGFLDLRNEIPPPAPRSFTTAAVLPLHRYLKAAHGTALAFRMISSTSPLPPA